MRPPNDVWQGCAGYWQSAFIRENLLPLGHAAWQGYLTQGRGVVVCDVAAIAASSMDWRSDGVPYRVHYLPAATVSPYLEAQRCAEAVIHRLMDTVQTYQPERDILMAIAGAGSLEIQWLQNLAIPPADCYQQVRHRWEEFALDPRSDQEHPGQGTGGSIADHLPSANP
jgi:hypothetical protein